jgi:Eukaryotic cytochrome b561
VVSKLPLSLTYTWHPLGSALMLLMGTVSLAASQSAYNKKRDSPAWDTAVAVHAVFNWLAVGALARGLYAIYNSKEENGRGHLTTTHAYMGVATVAFFAFNMAGGVAIKVSPTMYAKSVKQHRFFGYLAYGAIVASHASSLSKGYITKDERSIAFLCLTLTIQAASMLQGAAVRLRQLLPSKGGLKKKA